MRFATLFALLVSAALALASAPAAADCAGDCNDAYQAAMASCQEQYADAGEEIQLQQCIDDATSDYGTCTEACAQPE